MSHHNSLLNTSHTQRQNFLKNPPWKQRNGFQKWGKKIYKLRLIMEPKESTETYLPYARHYKPRLVYFLPHFWKPFLCFQGVFFRKFCPYVWLVFKTGLYIFHRFQTPGQIYLGSTSPFCIGHWACHKRTRSHISDIARL